VSAAHAGLLEAHYQRLGRQVYDQLAPDGRPVPYPRFARAMLDRPGPVPDGPQVEALRDRLAAMVRERSDGHRASLSREDVDRVLAGVAPPRNCHISPDVMLAAASLDDVAAGNYTLVLGEVHQVVYTWGSQLYFDDLREQTEAECRRHVQQMPDYDGLAVVLTERRHKGLLHESFPGAFVEVAAVPSQRARARVAIADVEVVADGVGIALRHRVSGERYRLYMAGDEQLHLWAVALPRVMPIAVHLPDGHTPRITMDGAVYQRERWSVAASTWGANPQRPSDADLLVRAARLRAKLGMPRYTYVHAGSEPKPYYVDFASPLALRQVQQLAAVNDRLTFTEMLPGPDDLWLREGNARYCCEFRMTAFRYPG
jgi:hypothetical protein